MIGQAVTIGQQGRHVRKQHAPAQVGMGQPAGGQRRAGHDRNPARPQPCGPQAGGGGIQHRCKAAEMGQERLGLRLGVTARNGCEQQHFQQFIIRQRVRPCHADALAHARPVPPRPRRGWLLHRLFLLQSHFPIPAAR